MHKKKITDPRNTNQKFNLQSFEDTLHKQEALFKPASDLYKLLGNITNQEHIEFLLPIMSNVEFFIRACPENLKLPDFIRTCIENLKFVQVEKGDPVFHFGDKGDQFFIILSGIAAVYVPKDEKKIEEESKERVSKLENTKRKSLKLEDILGDESTFRYFLGKSVKSDEQFEDELNLFNSGRKNFYFTPQGITKFQQIVKLTPGQSFGDVALTTDKPRGASIFAKTVLQMVSLSKSDYKKVFERQISLLKEKIELFIRLLPGTSRSQIQKLIHYFQEVNYQRNQIIWEEGDETDSFQLIRKGQVELTKKKKMMISILTEDFFFGDDDVLFKRLNRFYTCKAITNVQVLRISLKDFLFVRRHNTEIEKALRIKCLIKQSWMDQRINNLSTVHPLEQGSQSQFERRSVEQIQAKLKPQKSKLIRSQYIPQMTKQEMINVNTALLKLKQNSSEPVEIFSQITDQKQMKIKVEWEQKKRGLYVYSQSPVLHQEGPLVEKVFKKKLQKLIRKKVDADRQMKSFATLVKSSSTINESRGNINTSGCKLRKEKSLALQLKYKEKDQEQEQEEKIKEYEQKYSFLQKLGEGKSKFKGLDFSKIFFMGPLVRKTEPSAQRTSIITHIDSSYTQPGMKNSIFLKRGAQ